MIRLVDYTLTEADGQQWVTVVKDIDADTGGVTRNIHRFPAATVSIRAGEYGLTGLDEALDVVLHEPFLTDDPAAALLTARSIDAARIAHLERIAAVKRVHAKRSGQKDTGDVLTRLGAALRIDPDLARAHAARTRAIRARLRPDTEEP